MDTNTPLPPTTSDVTEDENYDFAALLRENDQERASAVDRSGGSKQIDATVVAVSADTVFLDIGYKTEGILPLSSFPASDKAVEPGDKVRVTVKGRDTDGYYELTRQRTATPKDYSSLEEAFEAKGTVLGTVTGVVKGGLTVDIGMRAFLPSSRSGTRDADEMAKLVGQEIRVRITTLDLEGGESGRPDAVVDRRSVVEEEARASADQRFSELAEGDVVNGTVRSLTEYGAFVDLAGADALLHISDMAWHRVANPADVLSVGDSVEAKILKIDATDPARRRISIGMKQLLPHPWDTVSEQFKIGDKVTGTVTRDADFGAFVEIAPGIEGLIHISEMAWGKKVRKPSDVVKVGDSVEAVILGIDTEQKRMSLGLKQALGDPWAELVKTVHAGSVVEGPVSSITKFGAFVTIAEGVEGMIHISEITAEKRLNHPSDVLRVGEVVQAQVLEIDREKRQLKLSIKQLVPTGIDEFIAEHAVGDVVTGRLIDLDRVSNTARVELGEGIIAMCSIPAEAAPVEDLATKTGPVDLSNLGSLLGSKWKTSAEPSKPAAKGKAVVAPSDDKTLKAGQIRSFRLTVLEPETKKLALELA
ncbi:S1 RNA-binding domain-containing protein [Granulicella tundricola]|uniref:RNA binding S1 domain protein n=1 Tax=Granulicella tundricola (strain ATCC BAA-1859 / DSM 23138 / MP5ACTX9) TaxID=1198114 RepID=E8X3P0_GRATM|nr:S1 RNA-binding domain-containing protein [Granulicella tundricola]ADW69318.1 RNA binding S1 domain protein [Granulicella tundricola MP5ACTX9]